MGLLVYVGQRFIPNLAQLTVPLRALLNEGSKFEWKDEQQRTFVETKKALENIPTLGYYSLTERTLVFADAGSAALGEYRYYNEGKN